MKKYILQIIAIASVLIISSESFLSYAQSTIRVNVKIGPAGLPVFEAGITLGGDLIGLTDLSGNFTSSVGTGQTNELGAVYQGNTLTKTLTFASGDNWMNFWFNPPPLPRDFDDNYYTTVVIGTQTWMAENLKTTHLMDGSNIPNITADLLWNSATTPGYCWYENNYTINKNTYGALYNWLTIQTENICPGGYHVPSDDEWTTLVTFLGGHSNAGSKLKETGTTHWLSPNYATNEVGFTGLPGGTRLVTVGPFPDDDAGRFAGLGSAGFWWTATSAAPGVYWLWGAGNSITEIIHDAANQRRGVSVRCMKNMLSSLTTNPVTSITSTSAQSGANITYDGGAEIIRRGLCWNTLPNPSISNDTTWYKGSSVTFSNTLRNLTPNTTYYVRAYATNSEGTAYGNEISFTTLAALPVCTTIDPTGVSSSGAVLNAMVNPEGSETDISFEYGPTTSYGNTINAVTSPVSGTAGVPAIAYLTGLSEMTTYHFRVVATNVGGTSTGNDMSFTTTAKVTDIDNNSYNTVKIGEQLWFQENLKVTKYRNGDPIPLVTSNWEYLSNTKDGAWCDYNYDEANGAVYGHLYNYYSTVDNRNLCPTGWHVPTDAEWVTMQNYLIENGYNWDGSLTENKIAKALATATGWLESETEGTVGHPGNQEYRNKSGFNGLPGGYVYTDGVFRAYGSGEVWWTSTQKTEKLSIAASIWSVKEDLVRSEDPSDVHDLKARGFSVRCILGDAPVLPAVVTHALAEKASTDALSGGDIISDGGSPVTERGVCWSTLQNPTIEDNHTSDGAGTGSFDSQLSELDINQLYYLRAYAINSVGTGYGEQVQFRTYGPDAIRDIDGNYYNVIVIGNQIWMQENLKTTRYNDGTIIPVIEDDYQWSNLTTPGMSWFDNDEATWKEIYGGMYNWYAVSHRNLCPAGWIVPTRAEWNILQEYLGGESVAGGKMKEEGTLHWAEPNTGADNSSGFTGLPGGYRNPSGVFGDKGIQGMFWTSDDGGEKHAFTRHLSHDDAVLFHGWDEYTDGISVRCMKDPSIVINSNDAGAGSFRNALEFANSNPGKDTITFNIPGEGVHSIIPLTPVPPIAEEVVIDGYTQPGAKPATKSEPATILIEIAGNASDNTSGLVLSAGNSIISGLSIKNFRWNLALSQKGNNIIKGNYFIGMNGTRGNIIITSSDNEIGGRSPASRNVITLAEAGNGIEINNTTGYITARNRIIGNYIGVDPTGEESQGNDFAGIEIMYSPDNIIGGSDETERNIISGNNTGIFIYGNSATRNRIEGNYIGTNAGGTKGIGNDNGIRINAPGNFIGGSTSGTGNLISGNGGPGGGIVIELGHGADGCTVQGNLIGTDQTGLLAIPNNLGAAISIEGGKNNQIGGLTQSARNIISGNNTNGIQIMGIAEDHAAGNKIQGNYIGPDISGNGGIGNSGNGIIIGEYASANSIGGIEPGAGNLIAFNFGAGVSVEGTFDGKGNPILSNSIYSNGLLGINLGNDNAVTDNDLDDSDIGPNNLQNFPVIDSLKFDLGNKSVLVGGYLPSTPNTQFTLQFFASKVPDNLGYGEGQTFIGSKIVTTDGYGKAPFNETFTLYSSWGDVITATATDPDGNTSEFSQAVGGLKEQTLAAINQPFYYKVNKDGVPNILDGTDITAVNNAFNTWTDVAVADIEFISSGTTTDRYASATDGVNLVSFMDDRFPFPPGVLAIAAKTLKVSPSSEYVEIIDADIVFNPAYVNHPEYNLGTGTNGYFDIQSVTTHEIGHVLGMIHSGVVNSTMFFMIGGGTGARDLEPDDIAWAGYRYPGESETTEYNYQSNYGLISGNITYGENGDPVGGALVYAINVTTNDSIHAYSDAWGNFVVPVPAPATYNTYNIYIEPLDGDVSGYPLKPCNISVYVYCNTNYTDYPGEFCSVGESASESTDDPVIVQVYPGLESAGFNIITNLDVTPPKVNSVLPEELPDPLPDPIDEALKIDVTQIFKITFSEPVNETTLTGETCYLVSGEGEEEQITTGSFKKMSDDPNVILFAPAEALKYETFYTLNLTTGITDLKNNTLDKEYAFIYKTGLGDTDPPAIKYIVPEDDSANVFITSDIRVFFSEPMDKESVENGFTLEFTEPGSAVTTNVSGSYTWKDSNTELVFTPLSSLREGTDFTVTIAGSVVDLAGISMGTDSVSSFTTVPQANPQILYIGPADLQSGVTIETPVVVDFSEPINPNTVNSETFMLMLGSNKVTGSFEFLNDNSRVVFRPETDLQFSQTYSVTLTTLIEDVSDPPLNLLNASNTSFATAATVTDPHIDYLEPVSGVVGALVTITGSGFDPDPVKNTIVFNGIKTQAEKASLTSVVAKVPVGTISGPVSLLVNGKASDNSSYFFVIPQSLDPCDDVIANVTTGTKSRDVDITADATTAYVTNPDAGTVSVIDMKSFLVKETITVGKEPFKIDINPAGTKAYVTNYGSHDVSVIELSTNKVVNTISVGINPYGVIVAPDGRSVYVANYSSEYVSVIDADPKSGGFDHVVANVSTGTKNTGITVTADAGYVLVAGNDGLKIISIDPSDLRFNTVIANVSTGTKTTAVDVIADAGVAFVATDDGRILIVNIYPGSDMFGAVIANVSTGSKIGDIQVSGDAMFVYVSDPDGNTVTVYKLTYGGTGTGDGSFFSDITLTLHNKIDVGDTPADIVIDPQNQLLLVVNSGETTEKNLTVIQICCGPIAPITSIGDLIIAVQTMINQGIVKQAIGNELIKHLNNALYYLSVNKTKSAINSLNTFVVKVKDLMKSRQITYDQGQPLVDAAEKIIADLKGTKTVDLDYLSTGAEGNEYDFIPESALGVIYPNPFSESVTVNFEVAESMRSRDKVTLRVYDINGRLVSTLINTSMQPGRYSVTWNGRYDGGGKAPYGTYILLFRTGVVNEAREMVLMK